MQAIERRTPSGVCPEHGLVTGEDVNTAYPSSLTCAKCGAPLDPPPSDDADAGTSPRPWYGKLASALLGREAGDA